MKILFLILLTSCIILANGLNNTFIINSIKDPSFQWDSLKNELSNGEMVFIYSY